jgi:hypothetical protein
VVPRRAPGASQAQGVGELTLLRTDFVVSLFPIFQLNIARSMRFYRTSLRIARVRCLLAGMLLGFLSPRQAGAQGTLPVSPSDDDSQFWATVQFAVPLRERTDLILSSSFRQGRDFSHPVYETGGAAVRFRLGRYLAFSPIYQFVATQYYPGVHTRENRLSINGVLSIPLKRLIVDNSHQFEERLRQVRNSNRYRNRVQVEWPFRFHDANYRLFVSDEVFYDSAYHAWNRNRFSVGGGKRFSSNLGVDLFFMKQNARFILPRDVNAIAVTFRIRLDRPIHHLP